MNFPLSFQEQIELLSERLEREGDIQAVKLLKTIENELDKVYGHGYDRGYNQGRIDEREVWDY